EVKYLRSLAQKKVRQAEGKFILEGRRSLREAVDAGAQIDFVAIVSSEVGLDELLTLRQRGIPIKRARPDDLDQFADTVHSQGVVALVRQQQHELEDVLPPEASLIVAADTLSDPGNLGTILRTCEWFGVEGLLLGAGCVELHNQKVVRSSAGAIF